MRVSDAYNSSWVRFKWVDVVFDGGKYNEAETFAQAEKGAAAEANFLIYP